MKRAQFKTVKRAVIKIGSSILTFKEGNLDPRAFMRLASGVSYVVERGTEAVIVSSGAIAAGVAKLGLRERPKTVPEKQAAAAVGQSRLMHFYEEAFQGHGITVGQILITHDDLRDRGRFLNARHTMTTLLKSKILPIVNENDSVAVEEIMVGDNDNLSALVAALVEADALIILSDIDGVYESDPKEERSAKFLPVIGDIYKRLLTAKKPGPGGLTVGGIVTKLEAAEKASQYGIPTVIANGRREGVLKRIFDGEEVGTLILPEEKKLGSRKHWIAYTLKPAGEIVVDEGAKRAIIDRGKSLLPIGVKEVKGAFGPGEAVRILGENRKEFARGLVELESSQIKKIKGLKTSHIERVLGSNIADEIVHRDNLVVLKTGRTPGRGE